MANPTSAFLRAGPSLVPSPVTATTSLLALTLLLMMPRTKLNLSIGWDLARTRSRGHIKSSFCWETWNRSVGLKVTFWDGSFQKKFYNTSNQVTTTTEPFCYNRNKQMRTLLNKSQRPRMEKRSVMQISNKLSLIIKRISKSKWIIQNFPLFEHDWPTSTDNFKRDMQRNRAIQKSKTLP